MSSKRSSVEMPDNGNRSARPKYKRVVVKVGTTLLTDKADHLNLGFMAMLVDQIALIRGIGVEVLLVSSGAVAAGRHVLQVSSGSRNVPINQVLAATGQIRLMNAYDQLFNWHKISIAQALITRKDLTERIGYLNIRNTLLSLLTLGVIPVINENDVVAVDELAGEFFGDNDNLSAMVANLVDADLLIMLGEVDGLHTVDPHLDPDAELISIVECLDAQVENMGSDSWGNTGIGGMVTKIEAAKIASESGVDVFIASGFEQEAVIRLVNGEQIGTFFPAKRSRLESRERWMLSGLSTKGEIVLDSGASKAIVSEKRSLLPAGVSQVVGLFQRGEIVSILDSSGGKIAAGIVNYSSDELSTIKGHKTCKIDKLLGHHYGDEIVHRSNMVIY